MTSWRESWFFQAMLPRGCNICPESCARCRNLLHGKKMGKEESRRWKACKKEFGRSYFLMKDLKVFGTSFFICISNRKSPTLRTLQWNSVWCWWNDNWAITKIHEYFPMENSHKVCCFSQIHEPAKKRPIKRNVCAYECKILYPLLWL